jgi:hypothetical protein
MANSLGWNSFTQSFMQGFSFVDNAFKSRRDEKRLDQRLKEERDHREFMRDIADRRATRADQQETDRRTVFEQGQDTKRLQDEAAALYSRGNLTDEEMRKYSRYDPRIAADLQKKVRRGEMAATAEELNKLGLTEGVQAQTAGVDGGTGATPASAPNQAAADAAASSQGMFAPDQGESAIQEIDYDEFRNYSSRYQNQGLWGQIKETVAGVGAHALDVVSDINPVAVGYRGADAALAAATDAPETTSSADVGASFGGNLHVPAERWFSEEEMEGMSQADRNRAIQSNTAVVQEYEARAASINSTKLVPNITTVGSISDVGKQSREEAIQYQRNAVSTFESYVNSPHNSSLQAALQNNPEAGLAMYYEMRNTVAAANPELAAQVDRNMVPLMSDQYHQLSAQIKEAPAGSRQQRVAQRKQANLVQTANIIYDRQPSINSQAGVTGGLKPGDSQRVQQVTAVVQDPNRPRPVIGAVPQSQYNSALTVAGRIQPGRRLNDRQIDALVTALDLNMIDNATFESVLMTGSWPPGKDPNGIKQMMKGGDGYIYATSNSGALQIIPTALAGTKGGKAGSQGEEFTIDVLDGINKGVALALGNEENMTPEISAAVNRFVINNAALLRNTFTVNSEEQQLLMGQLIHEAYIARQYDVGENYSGWFRDGDKQAPALSEYVFNDDVRRGVLKEMSEDTGKSVQLVQVPPRIRESNIDHQAIRNAISEGEMAHLGIRPEMADQYSPEQLEQIAYVGLELQERVIEDQRQLNQQFPLPQ